MVMPERDFTPRPPMQSGMGAMNDDQYFMVTDAGRNADMSMDESLSEGELKVLQDLGSTVKSLGRIEPYGMPREMVKRNLLGLIRKRLVVKTGKPG